MSHESREDALYLMRLILGKKITKYSATKTTKSIVKVLEECPFDPDPA